MINLGSEDGLNYACGKPGPKGSLHNSSSSDASTSRQLHTSVLHSKTSVLPYNEQVNQGQPNGTKQRGATSAVQPAPGPRGAPRGGNDRSAGAPSNAIGAACYAKHCLSVVSL